MNEQRRRARRRALSRYVRLVRLYPRTHREAFGTQMQQTFVDQYRDREDSQGHAGISFWLGVLVDAAVSIGREHLAAVHGAVARWRFWPHTFPGLILTGAVVAVLDGDARVLAVCALAAGSAFVAAGPAALVPKLLTAAGALSVVLATARFAALTGQWTTFFDAIVFLVTALLVAKTASGIEARLVSRSARLWHSEEVVWGLVIAALLGVAIGLVMVTNNDDIVPLAILIALAAVSLCSIAGWRVARESMSILAGVCASVSTLTIGMTLWLESVPIPIVLFWPIFRNRWIHGNGGLLLGPPTLQIWHAPAYWGDALRFVPRYLPMLLMTGVAAGVWSALAGANPPFRTADDRSLTESRHE